MSAASVVSTSTPATTRRTRRPCRSAHAPRIARVVSPSTPTEGTSYTSPVTWPPPVRLPSAHVAGPLARRLVLRARLSADGQALGFPPRQAGLHALAVPT